MKKRDRKKGERERVIGSEFYEEGGERSGRREREIKCGFIGHRIMSTVSGSTRLT